MLFGLLTLASGAASAGGGVALLVTVGSGASCDFDNLQAAINSGSTTPGASTLIAMSADMATTGVLVVDRNITIRGDYVSCDSLATGDARRAIIGNSSNSVIRALTTNATPRTLTLRDVIVRGGGADNASERGGGIHAQNRIALTLERVSVSDNVSVRGGGIAVIGASASASIDGDTIIGSDPGAMLDGNATQSLVPEVGLGGGIYCQGGALRIGNASVRGNTSSLHGGGVYLDDCDLDIEPDNQGSTRFQLTNNVAANGDGGGLYATNDSSILWRPLNTGGFAGSAITNIAGGRGGALFINESSDFIGLHVRFVDSRADDRGGAIFADSNALVVLWGGEQMRCLSWVNCPGITTSRGITEGPAATLIGGAIYARGGSIINLRQQHLYENSANNGSALHLSGDTTRAFLDGVLIARNFLYGVGNGASTVELTSSADIAMRHVTMAGNFRASNQFPLVEPALSSIRANGTSGDAEVVLRNSIFHNDADSVIRLLVGATVDGSCVLAHEALSFPEATVLDPEYVNTFGDMPDFGLSGLSPAIDRCPDSGATAPADVEGRARPLDLFDADNGPGTFDVGAFERFNDGLLRDGFELPLP